MEAKLTKRTIKLLQPADRPYEVIDGDPAGFLLRVQPSGSMTYYLAYRTAEGKRARYRIGRAGRMTPEQARAQAKKLYSKVLDGTDVQAEKREARRKQATPETLRAFINQRYGPWVTAERKTGKGTVQRLQTQFSHLMNKRMETITKWDLDLWQRKQSKTGKKAATINRDVTALKACLSKAVEWELIDRHPLANLKPRKVDSKARVRYLTDEEERRLRSALDAREEKIKAKRASANKWRLGRGYTLLPTLKGYADHIKPMVLLSINTGMRRGEVFNLKWNDIDFKNAMLTVEGSTAKSGQTRHIPLNAEALEVLRGLDQGAGLVFKNSHGQRFDNINTAWATVRDMAELKDFRWHDLRHCFASQLVMNGVSLNVVRELLGHSNLDMTLRYAHLSPREKIDAVNMLSKPRAVKAV